MLLRGLNVVEISASGAAAWATKDLADWGANVVVLEPPEGSPLRNEPPWYEREGERRSATWQWLSRGKTVVAAGPGLATTPEDALALCREADLVVAEHEPLAALLGLDHAGVRAALEGHSVVVRIAAFAPDGPYAHYRATDLGICSLGGWTGMLGAPDRYPLRPAGDLGTRATGLHALAAALFALRHHERGAAPSFVEVSAQAVAASLLTSPWLAYSMFGTTGFRRTASWPNASVRCKDGHAGILPLTHQHWASLCELTGLADVLDEPGGRELSYRQEHGAELWERVHEWYELRTREQVYFAGQAVRVPSGPVDSISQRLGDEQLEARGFFERAVVDGVMLRVPRVPYRIAGAPTLPRGAATGGAARELHAQQRRRCCRVGCRAAGAADGRRAHHRPDVVLVGPPRHDEPRRVRGGRDQGRVGEPAGLLPLHRRRRRGVAALGAQLPLERLQPEQARAHRGPQHGDRPRALRAAAARGRRDGQQLLEPRAAEPRLHRGAVARDQPAADQRDHAGLRPGRPLGRLRRLRQHLRAGRRQFDERLPR